MCVDECITRVGDEPLVLQTRRAEGAGHLRRDLQKLEALVASREGIVVVDGQTTEHEAILGTQGGQIRPVLRIVEVVVAGLEELGKRGIIKAIFEEIAEGVDLRFAQTQAARSASSARMRKARVERVGGTRGRVLRDTC